MASERSQAFMASAASWGNLAARKTGQAVSYLGATNLGREAGIGFAESFGFMYEPRGQGVFGSGQGTMFSRTGSYVSGGFMGWRTSAAGRYGRMFGAEFAPSWGGAVKAHPITGQPLTTGPTGFRGRVMRTAAGKAGELRAAGHFVKEGGVRRAVRGIGGKGGLLGVAGHALFAVTGAMALHEGYQQGGLTGAAGAGLRFGAEWGAMRAGMFMLGKIGITAGVMLPLAIAAAGAYGFYQFSEAAQEYGKQMKTLEMGAPITDPFGTVATTRQRSLMALNNTHINGRMAMGNEGILMHDGAYRR